MTAGEKREAIAEAEGDSDEGDEEKEEAKA
jgi:hypothetical protein